TPPLPPGSVESTRASSSRWWPSTGTAASRSLHPKSARRPAAQRTQEGPSRESNVSLEIRHLSGCTGQLQDVHARVRPIDDVDVAPIVAVDVVGLDGHLAALVAAAADAAFVGLVADGGNVVADFPYVERIADVERAHTGVEVRDEQDAV